MAVTVCVIAGEIAWWLGVAILGKQVVDRYKKYLNPKNWFRKNIEPVEPEQPLSGPGQPPSGSDENI